MTFPRNRGRLFALAAIAALHLLVLFPASAVAHAELLEATPADGATVVGNPAEISATFSEPLDPDRSTFSLRNAAGERLAVGQIDPADPSRMIIDPVPELAPGAYEVRWAAAGADGHGENDTWSFTVIPAPTPSPTPGATPGSTASAEPTRSDTAQPSQPTAPSPSASSGPSDPVGSGKDDVILPIIAALAIVLVATAFLLSRRGRPSDGV